MFQNDFYKFDFIIILNENKIRIYKTKPKQFFQKDRSLLSLKLKNIKKFSDKSKFKYKKITTKSINKHHDQNSCSYFKTWFRQDLWKVLFISSKLISAKLKKFTLNTCESKLHMVQKVVDFNVKKKQKIN